jgi:plasmid stabilization system protein ParE
MTVRFRVELSPQARDQLTTINLWWARNRPAAPTLVAAELEASIQQLATSPESGRFHDGSKPVQVRKLLMPRTRGANRNRYRPGRGRCAGSCDAVP